MPAKPPETPGDIISGNIFGDNPEEKPAEKPAESSDIEVWFCCEFASAPGVACAPNSSLVGVMAKFPLFKPAGKAPDVLLLLFAEGKGKL